MYAWGEAGRSSRLLLCISPRTQRRRRVHIVLSVWEKKGADDVLTKKYYARSREVIFSHEMWTCKPTEASVTSHGRTFHIDFEPVDRGTQRLSAAECVPITLNLPEGFSWPHADPEATTTELELRKRDFTAAFYEIDQTLTIRPEIADFMCRSGELPVQDDTGRLKQGQNVPYWLQLIYPRMRVDAPRPNPIERYRAAVALAIAGVDQASFCRSPFSHPHVYGYYVSWPHLATPYVPDEGDFNGSGDWFSTSEDFRADGESGYDCEDVASGVCRTASREYFAAEKHRAHADPVIEAMRKLAREYIPCAVETIAYTGTASRSRRTDKKIKKGGRPASSVLSKRLAEEQARCLKAAYESREVCLHMYARLYPVRVFKRMLENRYNDTSSDEEKYRIREALDSLVPSSEADSLPILTIETTDGIAPSPLPPVPREEQLRECVFAHDDSARVFCSQRLFAEDDFYLISTSLYSEVSYAKFGAPTLLLADRDRNIGALGFPPVDSGCTIEEYHTVHTALAIPDPPSPRECALAQYIWEHRQWPLEDDEKAPRNVAGARVPDRASSSELVVFVFENAPSTARKIRETGAAVRGPYSVSLSERASIDVLYVSTKQ